ncbi:MAG: phospholipid-binding protein, partial [Candidatus Eremiobacteraeota bacterium]|nr:phospholipid-binding protein [Candidatus Eremiobacteraeota bacterium]
GKPHHYVFTLYAMDVPRIGDGGMGGRDLSHAMRGHIIASAHITGFYGR